MRTIVGIFGIPLSLILCGGIGHWLSKKPPGFVRDAIRRWFHMLVG